MPVHAPALSVMPLPVTPPPSGEAAPSPDSGKDFEATLSTALGEDSPGTSPGDPRAGGNSPNPDVAAATETLAGGGNPLPPALPPQPAATTPGQIVAMVLEALTVQTGAAPAAVATTESEAIPNATLMPRALQAAPENVLASLRAAPTAAAGEMPVTPALFMTAQAELTATDAGGTEHFKQAVMENMSRLGSVAEVAGANNAPAPFALAPGNMPLTASAPATASLSIPVSFGQAAWGQAMGQQVAWAVSQNMSSAELHLSPPELGPVSVRIKLDADQASISFAAAHGAVREAIEAALPRLRDMLATQGIALADVNVSSHENFHQAQRESGARGEGGDRGHGSEQGSDAGTTTRRQSVQIGVLDVYV